ncbi:pyruvate dehydrogenase E2 component (dihydrolipoamide acetyltransferase) [Halarchaeum rubridurum]|uniref:Branched-chain alpha-keto acid dehydrogenase subunit E2 n=1 Tax=Halarchaeum rubridurum TaxID=489911 RepID=A0A830FM78_9EURY|nr:2-oxo acid dehydrogenase subunit E2 [Halarchaeum rubridurum]MBP1954417.1 pyruvate dehydrogenase E2 component (dihydrolipoamide acetyltransferase) [Halarchaeum rubridurum]GGM60869.1 branched-chain alpha-keto acid dehydrogenase subunit E2 [Halarchaeum rubridurum]
MVEQSFELPDLGEGIAEGELVAWAVAPGDHVEQDQVIAEVETDKALVEVPSPYDGTVTELHAEEGEMVPVDYVIATFEIDASDAEPAGTEAETDESSTPVDAGTVEAESAELETAEATEGGAEASEAGGAPGGRVFAAPSTRSLARDLDVDIETVEGTGAGGRVTESDVRRAAESASESGASEPASGADATPSEAEPVVVESAGGTKRERTLAMPATRRLARERGVDINDVPASEEREGEPFVTPADVEAYVESGGSAAETGASAERGASASAGAAAGGTGAGTNTGDAGAAASPGGERVPYRGIRRTIGEQMAQSKFTAPHVTHHDEFDASGLVDLRAELAEIADEEDVNLTYLPFVVKAVTSALKEVPYLNASLDEEAGEIVLHDEYNIGIAVATDDGLLVPVIKHADRKGLKELAREIDELATQARERSLPREAMRGGTFTITNIGVIGGEYSSPIINYPEAGIFAMGPIKKRPWVVDDEVVARKTMTISMSVDHRLVDGAEAAQFTNHVQTLLADPARLVLE